MTAAVINTQHKTEPFNIPARTEEVPWGSIPSEELMTVNGFWGASLMRMVSWVGGAHYFI